jgi:hypothetical protein
MEILLNNVLMHPYNSVATDVSRNRIPKIAPDTAVITPIEPIAAPMPNMSAIA